MAPNRLKFAFFRLQLHEFVKYTIFITVYSDCAGANAHLFATKSRLGKGMDP